MTDPHCHIHSFCTFGQPIAIGTLLAYDRPGCIGKDVISEGSALAIVAGFVLLA